MITGASKGLGLAITALLLSKPDTQVVALARTLSPGLEALQQQHGSRLQFAAIDVTQLEAPVALMETLYKDLRLSPEDRIALINNAGGMEPMGPLGTATTADYRASIDLNLTAPIVLSNQFIALTTSQPCDRKILNISSGAGKNPISGWSSYCAAKAGLDMLTRVIATEQKDTGIKCLSFGPGIMDTFFQEKVRTATADQFERIEQFIQFKAEGKLLKAEVVAQVVVDLLFDVHPFVQGGIVSVQDYL